MFFNEHLLKHLKTNFSGVPHILKNQKKTTISTTNRFQSAVLVFSKQPAGI